MLEKIRERCQQRGITLNELCAACGIGQKTIYKWGTVSPSVANIKKVADYFGCTVDELISD